MGLSLVTDKIKTITMNRNGFTFLTAIFLVMIIGIMSAETGRFWTMIMKREHEKELLFRGSQIKEAIENWNDQRYKVDGVGWTGAPKPLMDLKDLLQNPYTLKPLRYLPHTYATELDTNNPKCAPDCPKLKIYQDPMTGKEWTIIRGTAGNATTGQVATISTSAQGAGIIGVASKSDEEPLKTDFKDTALETMGSVGIGAAPGGAAGTVPQVTTGTTSSGAATPTPGLGGKMTKYNEWKFIADPPGKNDHSKIYRAYHERW
jgi:type II secretory pathway pseudopilin PulG